MKRFAILILALCLVLAMTACDLRQVIQEKIGRDVSEGIGEVIQGVGELAEGFGDWKFGQLIYSETDNFSVDANGVETVMHTEIRYSYDDKGNQVFREETSTVDGGAPDTERTENVYDENGNLLKCVSTYNDKVSTYEYEYDSDGRMTKMATTYADGSQSISLSEYDAEGREIRSTYKGADGDSAETTYAYDEKGNQTALEWKTTDADGVTYISRSEDTFDENGNVVRSVSYSNGEQLGTSETEYDAEGRMIKSTYTDSDGSQTVTEYTYDANGNEIGQRSVDREGKESVMSKEYDANGNLLRAEDKGESYHSLDVSRYDANGNQVYNRFDSWYGEEHNYNVSLWTYDDDGRVLTYTNRDSVGTCEAVVNVYDKYGYQIKTAKTCSNPDGSGYSVIERDEYDFGEPLG